MSLDKIYQEISKNMDDEYYIALAENDVMIVPVIIDILISNRKASHIAQRLLEKISAKNPLIVYPYAEYIMQGIEKSSSFTKWNNWKIITNLLDCDYLNLWSKIKLNYLDALRSDQIAEFSIACDCVLKVITAKPDDREEIMEILNNVASRKFRIAGTVSEQCNLVAREKVSELLENIK